MSQPVSLPYTAARNAATAPLSSTGTFAGVAFLVLIGDLVSKMMAVGLWSGERQALVGRLVRIDVVLNPLGAFGTSLGAYTREINVGATVLAVLLATVVCHRLARLDAIAPAALGLIAGAGLGNLASMAISPAGVPDFLAIAHTQGSLVMNLADVAAYIGVACCARIAWSLVRVLAATGLR